MDRSQAFPGIYFICFIFIGMWKEMYNINQKIEGKYELFTSKRATEIERFNWERNVDIVSI